MQVYERVRKYITDNGIKIAFVAERSGIKRGRLYRVMDGTSILTADELKLICTKALHVDPEIFFADDVLETKTKQSTA